MTDVKVSKDEHISKWVDQENLIMLDEKESATKHKNKEGDW